MITADIEFHEAHAGLSSEIAAAALKGLRLGGEHVLKLSRDIVPLEEGTLERSGMVSDDGKGVVAVSYDVPYAVRQHEDLDLRHDPGRSAKYLEKAVAEGQGDIAQLVAAQVRQITGSAA